MRPEPAACGRKALVPYILIALASLFSHGFILTNDGTIWDSWYVLNFLQTRNWATMHDFFDSVGMPLYAWLYRPFAYAPDIVTTFMTATFLCLLGNGILTYHLALRLGRLTRDEALALALLTQAMPVFSAAQDFIMFFFIFTHTLFLASALLAAVMLDLRGWRRRLARVLAALGFVVSFSNAALLVFYGCVYLLLLFRYRRLQSLPFLPALGRFVAGFPDLLLLPPAAWLARVWLTPQYGWYEFYNNPVTNLPLLAPNFLSFFQNALPYHARSVASWPKDHPLLSVLMAAVVILAAWRAPQRWHAARGSLSSVHLVWFGGVSLCLAVLPFAAAGKTFSPSPLGEHSRHAMLTGLPLAILVLASLRVLCLDRQAAQRWFAPVAGCLAIVLASRLFPVYLHERAEWIYSRAVVSAATGNDVIRNSSIIGLQGYSVVQQNAYALYGVAVPFGDMTRFFTARVAANRQFFTPAEIERMLLLTTFLPGDFRHIDPSGRQVRLIANRLRGPEENGEVVFRYLGLRSFGTRREMDEFLSSLVELRIVLLKPATRLVPSSFAADAGVPDPGVPTADFTNGAGMRMVLLPEGWWAAKHETTQAQYLRLMSSNPSLFVDPSRPVERVSWLEATEFCRRLSAGEAHEGRLPGGFAYRLPTVREFDRYAADASLLDAVTSTQELRWHTEPVGSLAPNRLGIHDAIGNVWEWCLDGDDRAHRFKVSKGGSWVNHARDLSPFPYPRDTRNFPVDRLYGPLRNDRPDQGFWDRGFRCVLAPAAAHLEPPPAR